MGRSPITIFLEHNTTIINAGLYQEYLPYLLIVIGFSIVAYALVQKDTKSILKETGIETEGIVFSRSQDFRFNLSSYNNNNVKNKITIRFLTEKKEWITGDIDQNFEIFYSFQYKDGEKVKVFYDRDNPSNFFVDSKQSPATVRIYVILSGLLIGAFGIYNGFLK